MSLNIERSRVIQYARAQYPNFYKLRFCRNSTTNGGDNSSTF